MIKFKKIASMALAATMLCAMSVSSFAGDVSCSISPESEAPSVIFRAPMYREKTVIRDYDTTEDIPTRIYYEEYDGGVTWKGNLYFVSSKRIGHITNCYYEATFSGTLTAHS